MGLGTVRIKAGHMVRHNGRRASRANASDVRQRQRVSVTKTKAAPSKAIPVVDAGDTRPSGWRV